MGRSWADAAFGSVRRVPVVVSDDERRVEAPPPTAPLHRYVSLFGADRGVTVYSDGLAEYEAEPTGDVAVTLVRSVADLSRNDLPERPGHAGWPVPTPEAQNARAVRGGAGDLPARPANGRDDRRDRADRG